MKRSRSAGEGAVYRRKDGLWCGELFLGYDKGKRQRRFVYGKSRSQAVQKLKALQLEQVSGHVIEPTKLIISALLHHWVTDVSRPIVRDATYKSYEGIVRVHICPRVGNILVQKISVAHIQELLSSLEKDGVSARVRQLVLLVLTQALRQAVKYDWVRDNVCEGIRKT